MGYLGIGRLNDDFTFETCDQRTSDDVRRERVVSLLFFLFCTACAFGIPVLLSLGKVLFFVEPIIY